MDGWLGWDCALFGDASDGGVRRVESRGFGILFSTLLYVGGVIGGIDGWRK